MINSDLVRNIREIDDIKLKLLENVTNIFKGLEDENIDIKSLLIKNIDLTDALAKKLEIDLVNRR